MLKAFSRVSAIVLIAITALLASPTIAKQNDELEAYELKASNFVGPNKNTTVIVATIKASRDDRAERLESFLQSQGSPLAPYSADLVKISDIYRLDWRLLPAITGVESTFGNAVPGRSYNPYGWNNGHAYFKDWVSASDFVAKEITVRWGVGETITPWKIGPSYAASPTWASRVNSYMKVIGQYQ
ncbi:MAG: hypothetical protein A2126_03520 [Candidatus Woykebacteria bacterium GWB1_45_5]|uniref:Mannosyl-glycoprotein endo-beta-N-acetylglucosamidase-like domain-containing protein n=2 Tax=Candidatus Woykeibacteriota TaxID=1817899 RepID=A0A1G1W3L4_9BACT|nr:MAG: hypothetical protein A2113_03285 [Candidatus Woykebacteria bacterium GWA1_44_8]OGY24490.1 MAG: hypothetical protein A2126_03520 [Candidatus Woykebacteria bacterium GWB1_45_5]